MKIEAEINNKEVRFKTPYDRKTVQKFKQMKGRWDYNCWVFPIKYLEFVKKMLIENFGDNGIDPTNYFNIKLTYSQKSKRKVKINVGYNLVNITKYDNLVFLDDMIITKGYFSKEENEIIFNYENGLLECIVFDVPEQIIPNIENFCEINDISLSVLADKKIKTRYISLKTLIEQKEYLEIKLEKVKEEIESKISFLEEKGEVLDEFRDED